MPPWCSPRIAAPGKRSIGGRRTVNPGVPPGEITGLLAPSAQTMDRRHSKIVILSVACDGPLVDALYSTRFHGFCVADGIG